MRGPRYTAASARTKLGAKDWAVLDRKKVVHVQYFSTLAEAERKAAELNAVEEKKAK